jgi:hypothetical protein
MIPMPPRRRKPRERHPIMPLAQAMELRDRYDRAQIKHDLKPGMLCKEKAGLAYFSDAPVLILWRMLDTAEWLDRQIIRDYVRENAISRCDCIVARLSDDSTHINFVPHTLECLEPYSDEEAATPKRARKQPIA